MCKLTLRSSMKTSKLSGALLSVVANVFAVVALWNLWSHIFVKVGERCLDGKVEMLEAFICLVTMLHNVDGTGFTVECKLSPSSSPHDQFNFYSSLRKKLTKAAAIGQTQDQPQLTNY